MSELRDVDRRLLQCWVARQDAVWAEREKEPWAPGQRAPIYLGIDSITKIASLSRGQAGAAAKRLVNAGLVERIPGTSRTVTIYRLTREGVREARLNGSE